MLEFVHPGSSMFILWNPHQNFASKNSSLNRELMSSVNNTCLIMSLSLKNPWRHLMSQGFASILCVDTSHQSLWCVPLFYQRGSSQVVAHGLASGRRKTRFCERLRFLAAKLKVEFLNGFIWWTFLLWSGLCHRVPFFCAQKGRLLTWAQVASTGYNSQPEARVSAGRPEEHQTPGWSGWIFHTFNCSPVAVNSFFAPKQPKRPQFLSFQTKTCRQNTFWP